MKQDDHLQMETYPQMTMALQARLTAFVRLARCNGFCGGIDETLDAHRIAQLFGITHPVRLKWGLRSLLCGNQDDWERFDALFDAYWGSHAGESRVQPMPAASTTPKKKPALSDATSEQGGKSEADTAESGESQDAAPEGSRGGASVRESLLQTDFQFITDAGQMHAVERLAERLARTLRKKRTRREQIEQQGRRIHLRRTVRNSLRYGGTPLKLAFKTPKKRPPHLLLIVDVSRSMALYSMLFLRFARGVVNAFSNAEVFAYHTRLVHITHAMRQPDLIKLKHSLALISQGWSGGTRIGECLATFNLTHSRLLNSRSLVIIVSDGLDTGDPGALSSQLAQMKRRFRKLIWLNPLLGRPGYEPKTAGMLAALPLIDLFAPAHNLRSLMALEPELVHL